MREIRTSGSMSGDGKRDDVAVAPAPILDSTENKGRLRTLFSMRRPETRPVETQRQLAGIDEEISGEKEAA